MKLEQQPDIRAVSGPFVPPFHARAEDARDEALRELRDLWPSAVDLAKQPGLLYRLHAILNV